MAVEKDILYIKAEKNKEVTKAAATLGDVLSMECTNQNVLSKVKTLKLVKAPGNKENRVVVSVLKVISLIHEEYPNLQIENMGEIDFIVTFENQKTPGKLVHFVKTAGVMAITFFGAAFSIMAFNNDVDTTKLFSQIYELVMGKQTSGFTILELTYCVGLIIGILTFFNHFGGKKFSVDPTPMEIEMRTYEDEIQDTLIESYSRRGKELDVGKTDTAGTYRA